MSCPKIKRRGNGLSRPMGCFQHPYMMENGPSKKVHEEVHDGNRMSGTLRCPFLTTTPRTPQYWAAEMDGQSLQFTDPASAIHACGKHLPVTGSSESASQVSLFTTDRPANDHGWLCPGDFLGNVFWQRFLEFRDRRSPGTYTSQQGFSHETQKTQKEQNGGSDTSLL